MARFSALLDACVLVPIALADTRLRLAEADLCRPLCSETILEERVMAIEEIHPDLGDGRARHRADVTREQALAARRPPGRSASCSSCWAGAAAEATARQLWRIADAPASG